MTKEKKNKGGRPLISFSPEQVKKVEELAGKLNCVQISEYFDINPDTFNEIKKRQPEVYRAYKKGRLEAINKVGDALLEKAASGDTGAAAFYLKTQSRWAERHNIKLKFPKDKSPIEIIDTVLDAIEKGEISAQEATQIASLANLKATIQAGMPSEENTNVREGREEIKRMLAGLDRLEEEQKK